MQTIYPNFDFIFYHFYLFLGDVWQFISSVNLGHFFLALAGLITIALTIVAAYSFIRLKEIREREEAYLKTVKLVKPTHTGNERWAKIEQMGFSNNESEWKQAIIDADTLLDELVTRMGYKGDSLADKMKKIEASDFTSLSQAWDAHKIRNKIAHGGGDFTLTQHETRRVINLYREVFSEFNFL